MKIINVDVARTSWLFPFQEINPAGRSFTQAFIELKTRYKFKKAPTHTLDFDTEAKGLIFDQGEFVNRDGISIIAKLSIFTDGIVSDTWSSTRDSEDLLEDVMKWVKTEHGFSLPTDRMVRKLYLSSLTVTTEKGQIPGRSKLEALAEMVSMRLTETGRTNKGYIINGFSLSSADWDQPGAPVPYRFEIKTASHPGENRYYASAPLPTNVHITLLEEQERLFG
jgi:hypothetical protein